MSRPANLRAIFAVPLAIAAISVAGLIVALTGDGLRDVASWIALAVPLLAVCWAMAARQR